jgi:adenylyltransferase/sulfurtransferase
VGDVEINAEQFNELLKANHVTVIDVRQHDELPEVTEFAHSKIPLSELRRKGLELASDTIVLFCQTGNRSLKAAEVLKNIHNGSKKIYSLKGGIVEWKRLRR